MTYNIEYLDDDYEYPDGVIEDYPYSAYDLTHIYKAEAIDIIKIGKLVPDLVWNPTDADKGLRNVRFKKKFLKFLDKFYNKYPVQR